LPPTNRTQKVDPRDRAQLKEAPVSLRRVLSLFTGHRSDMIVVTVMIVATSMIGLGQPFLIREIVDVAIPTQDVRVLLWCVGGMVAVALFT
jgi:ATP-binding cassette subfamily B protein